MQQSKVSYKQNPPPVVGGSIIFENDATLSTVITLNLWTPVLLGGSLRQRLIKQFQSPFGKQDHVFRAIRFSRAVLDGLFDRSDDSKTAEALQNETMREQITLSKEAILLQK